MDTISHIAHRLLAEDTAVVVIDDLSSQAQMDSEAWVTGSKVELWYQLTMMALNSIVPVVAGLTSVIVMFASGILPRAETDEYSSGAGETETQIGAASYAFAIWGVIYPSLFVFVVYQVLPSEWVPQRNDEMIYYYLNVIFIINAIANASWFPFAFDKSQWSLILSTIVIWIMLATGLAMMGIADQSDVWWPEVFTVRFPFSVYTGWLIAANLLSTTSMLKSWGMRDPQTAAWELANPDAWNFLQPLMVISEENWIIILLWVSEIFVELIAWGMRDFVFGAVFAWAAVAVLVDTLDERAQNVNLVYNISTIIGIHSISMISLVSYLIFEILQPWYEPISFWGGGSIGKTDWSEMFTDVNYLMNIFEEYFIGTVSDRLETV